MLAMKAPETLRGWEDATSFALGLAAAAAPWFFYSFADAPMIVANGLVVGMTIMVLAMLDLLLPRHWEEPIEMLCGAWLMVAPTWLGYGGGLMTIHFAAGALVFLLACAEFWQERNA